MERSLEEGGHMVSRIMQTNKPITGNTTIYMMTFRTGY